MQATDRHFIDEPEREKDWRKNSDRVGVFGRRRLFASYVEAERAGDEPGLMTFLGG